MFKYLFHLRFFGFLALLLSLLVTSSPSEAAKKAKSVAQLLQQMDNLKTGMTPAEVEKLCGKPDFQFTTQFGRKTSDPWRGLVYLYETTPDSLYREIPALKHSTLVFSFQGDKKLLHHWEKK